MTQPRYPPAQWMGDGGREGDGQGWGPLPDRGATVDQIRLVFHTTEGTSMPGYRDGKDAPHTTYDPRTGQWYQHNEHDRRTGTLEGISATGTLGNEFSIQTEIIAFSDKAKAQWYGGIWVGDFLDVNYADLAAYVAWCRDTLFVPHLPLVKAYGPADDFKSFLWGKDDSHEMSPEQWLNAGGILTGHGAADNQRHWDPGELDLWRVIRESLTSDEPGPDWPLVLAQLRDLQGDLADIIDGITNHHDTG